MKNPRTVSFLCLLIISLMYTNAFSQDYVVTAKGDTIKGEVKPSISGNNSSVRVIFSDKKKTTYPLFQVRSFFFKKETYQPLKGPNGYTFMKLQKSGYLSLYTFQLQNQITFDGYYLTKMDGSGIEVPNLGFKKILTNFLSECDDVVAKIDKGDLGKRNLDEIIDQYNVCIQNKTINYSQLIVQQEVKSTKINSWYILEEKVKKQAEFEGKANALEMITDIKGKISRDENVPNFLIEGLKSILNPTELKVDLENALSELK